MQRFKVMQICANGLAIIIQLGISDVKRDYDVLWLTGNARRCFYKGEIYGIMVT